MSQAIMGQLEVKKHMPNQQISAMEFFYFEWLVIQKKMTQAEYAALSAEENRALAREFSVFLDSLVKFE